MKFKTRQRRDMGWTKRTVARRMRCLAMPQFLATNSSERAADAVHARCGIFKMMKRINRMPRRRMNGVTLQQLFGGSTLSAAD